MKITRLAYDPGSALVFYEQALGSLGALCERTWHDRLEIVAEGRAARPWNGEGALHAQELFFAPADVQSARDAAREIFPGCPLTFRIAELLRPMPLTIEKAVLRLPSHARAPARAGLPAEGRVVPEPAVLEKLWRVQYPHTRQWRLASELKACFHLSLVAVARCEIQAIDQHWSAHRLAMSLPGAEPDELLAQQIPLLELEPEPMAVDWKLPKDWWPLLQKAIRAEMEPDLEPVRARQQQYLQRELQRIDEYFAQYEQELSERASRGAATNKVKLAQRLEAARAEHARRRNDQVARHEIRVQPHLDALLWVAEAAWQVAVDVDEQRIRQTASATFVPRARRWFR